MVVLGYEDQVFAELSGTPRAAPVRVPFAALSTVPALRRLEHEGSGERELALRPGEVFPIEVAP